jgi:ATP-dependent exoDNAse (exonuclease V) beta subunit
LPAGYETPQIRITTDANTKYKPTGRSRGPDLLKLLDGAHQQAARGLATIPREVAPVPVDPTAQRQFSFSRLTGQLIRPEGWHAPSLSEGRGTSRDNPTPGATTGWAPPEGWSSSAPTAIDPRSLGILVHDVLERIDFANPADVKAWCEHLAPSHVIQNTEPAARLACSMIERFAKSARCRELATATTIHREIDFLLAWPPGETNTTGQYIQGVIDCLYQDPTGNWHIMDFKTNDITAAKVPHVAHQYELQLHVYAIAIERTLGQSPTELVLHFLRPGAEHTILWNEKTRTQAIKTVTQAIAQTLNPEC